MKLTITPTKTIGIFNNGTPARVWSAEYNGQLVEVLVCAVGLDKEAPAEVQEAFEVELRELVGGPVAYITNMDAADDVDVKSLEMGIAASVPPGKAICADCDGMGMIEDDVANGPNVGSERNTCDRCGGAGLVDEKGQSS